MVMAAQWEALSVMISAYLSGKMLARLWAAVSATAQAASSATVQGAASAMSGAVCVDRRFVHYREQDRAMRDAQTHGC